MPRPSDAAQPPDITPECVQALVPRYLGQLPDCPLPFLVGLAAADGDAQAVPASRPDPPPAAPQAHQGPDRATHGPAPPRKRQGRGRLLQAEREKSLPADVPLHKRGFGVMDEDGA
jgi:hypothetical protein